MSSKFTPTKQQLDILEAFKNTRVLKVNAIAGSGKEQPISCLVKTPEGDKRIGDLTIGDSIFGANGGVIYVTGIFPQGMKDVYRVTFRDGSSTRCGIEHNWSVSTIGMRNKSKFVRMTLREMIEYGVLSNHNATKMKIPLTKPVEYPSQNLELHPYILGVFLGDGSFTSSTVHISMHKDDTFIFDKVFDLFQKHNGLVILNRLRSTSENGLQTTLVVSSNNEANPVTKLFTNIGVNSSNKTIPKEYMIGSVEQRIDLLKGLMDTDGCSRGNRISFSNTNYKLVMQIKELVQSLGGTAILGKPDSRKTTSVCYHLNIKVTFNPFSLARKTNNWKCSTKNPPSRYITSIEKLDYQEDQVCISVSAEDNLYLTDEFIVTHNTSTLELLAEVNQKPSLLLAFNKSIADEAAGRFPKHVSCRTMNSVAYAEYGRGLQHKLNYNKDYSTNTMRSIKDTVNWYKMQDYTKAEPPISARTMANLAREAVDRFCHSSRPSISRSDLHYKDFKELEKNHDFDSDTLGKDVITLAKKIWKERTDPVSKSFCTHDTYVKLWSLSNPRLNYDIIYVDESQDINPCVLHVLEQQICKVLYVGDQYQSIYGFRGAVNAMKKIEAPTMHLSQSWRYGKSIAQVAEAILSEDSVEVQGNPLVDSRIVPCISSKNYTMIFRTNSALLEAAESLIDQGVNINIQVNVKDFINQVKSTVSLYKGKTPFHDMIARFGTWSELLEYSKEDVEVKRLVEIASRPDVEHFISALEKVKECKNPDVILTTAHKSKGLEFDNVIVANDFKFGEKELLDMPEQEINLLYVACTRAKKTLQLPDKLQ